MNNFWSDKSAGIDYRGFLRIFSKSQVKYNTEKEVKESARNNVKVKPEIINLKKKIFD